MQNFVSFKKCPDAAQAREVEQLLLASGIRFLSVDNGSSVDTNLGGGFLKDYEIKLQPEDFKKAGELLLAQANEWTNDIPKDYYLLTFTNEELYEVVEKKDEWSDFDYVLAQKLLKDRGVTIGFAKLRELEKERLLQLAKPDDLHFGWIIAGYVFALLGGLFGVISGYLIYTSKKTLPNGTKIYSYSSGRRAQGKNILIISIIVLVISALLRILASIMAR